MTSSSCALNARLLDLLWQMLLVCKQRRFRKPSVTPSFMTLIPASMLTAVVKIRLKTVAM